MNIHARKEPWQDYLPNVYHWLASVPVDAASALPDHCHVIVPCQARTDQGLDFLPDAGQLPDAIMDQLRDQAKQVGWRGKSGNCKLTVGGRTFLLVVLGNPLIPAVQRARQVGLDAATALTDHNIDHLVFLSGPDMDASQVFEGFAWGLYPSGLFRGKKPGTDAQERLPSRVALLRTQASSTTLQKIREMAQAAAFTRMLQDAPPNWMYPATMAEIAEELANQHGHKHRILGHEQMEREGMGSFLAVGKGSEHAPRLICVEIAGEDTSQTISFVGKGLTFDAGGISIKPAQGMDEMKYDMSGAAALLGAVHFFSRIKPRVNLVFAIGAAENMVSGRATRPGDIVTSMSGKTIEIGNTDAEGRLVLADVLTYVIQHFNPLMIVDFATLTGAVAHGLGSCGAAYMTRDEGVANMLQRFAGDCGEPLWRLPLWAELEKDVKSDIADLVNIAKPNVKAGTIMGGHFLREFAGTTPWAHVDIAATAWSCQAAGYPKSGGAAFGIRTIAEIGLRFEGIK